MKTEKSTISNQSHEINYAADKLGVFPVMIHIAKYILKTNDRKQISDWVKENRGRTIEINVQ